MSVADNARALSAALVLGLPAFPCRVDKTPACPHGYCDATADPVTLRELWRRYPAPLAGAPTGEASWLDALDIDAPRHPETAEWWMAHRGRLPQSRMHRTRSGGLHLLFRHAAGLRCSVSRIAPGIDVRADGGYVVWWPAAGEPVQCDAAPAPWPQWLLDALTPPPARRSAVVWTAPSDYRSLALRWCSAAQCCRAGGASTCRRPKRRAESRGLRPRPAGRGGIARRPAYRGYAGRRCESRPRSASRYLPNAARS
jgi:hypothetical protein